MSGRRILFHHRIRANDGQAVHVRELIGALRRLGHEVLECALVPKAAGESDSSRPGLWQRLSLPRFAVEVLEMAYSRKGLAMMLTVANRFRPDFIYERHALHCRAGLLAAQHLSVPLLLEVNSPMTDEMTSLDMLRFPRAARRCERQVLGHADRVLPVSEVLAARLEQLGADRSRLRVVRNGADPDCHGEPERQQAAALRRELGLSDEHLVVGFVGYMRDWHRLDLALAAMANQALGAMHLVLAGDGPALEEVRQRALALGLADRVHELGEVPHERIPSVCRAFDVALVPAINEYASPLKVFDSLAAGVTTLAPDQPNLRELVEDGETAVLFPPNDAAALTEALVKLAQDRQLVSRIGAAGRQLLLDRDWTWAGAARRVIAAYEELAA